MKKEIGTIPDSERKARIERLRKLDQERQKKVETGQIIRK